MDGLKAGNRPEMAELVPEVTFEQLKQEMMDLEVFVEGLVLSLNNSNSSVESLYQEVQNISNMVNQLESLDKNNLMQVRRDMDSLKKRLHDCETTSKNTEETPSVPYGSCDHNGLAHVGKPFLVQLNWKGSNHKYGGWGRDTAVPPARKNLYWVAPLNIDGRILEAFRHYSSYNDFLMYRNPTDKQLSLYMKSTGKWNHTKGGQGGGMTVHGNFFYYNCYNTRDMCRFNLKTGAVERKTLPNAAYNNRFSYSSVAYQDMDFASDERGLWVLYATEKSSGNIVISKLDVKTFSVVKSWTTTVYRSQVSNAFMMCGAMYAVRPVSKGKQEIFYMFDTKTNKGKKMSMMMETLMEPVQSLNYNANDHKFYMYSDGFEIMYDLTFNP
ncbi:olfactomedin-like [Lissotriton helveticus]